jgi:hypothetical protein
MRLKKVRIKYTWMEIVEFSFTVIAAVAFFSLLATAGAGCMHLIKNW